MVEKSAAWVITRREDRWLFAGSVNTRLTKPAEWDTIIGTEHLLLGLVRLEEGAAVEVLRKLGVTAEQIAGKPPGAGRWNITGGAPAATAPAKTPAQKEKESRPKTSG